MKAILGLLVVLSGWSVPAISQCLADGVYEATATTSYECCWGTINFNVDHWDVTITGTQIEIRPVPRGTLPEVLGGSIDCDDGTFVVSAYIPGGCAQSYNLQGQIETANSWSGTFNASYRGNGCHCTLSWCDDQQLAVWASLSPTAVGSVPSLGRIDVAPNPFSGSTTIRVHLERRGAASVDVVDVSGRVVASLVEAALLDRGDYQFLWDARGDDGSRVANGVYFVRLRSESIARTAKVLVID